MVGGAGHGGTRQPLRVESLAATAAACGHAHAGQPPPGRRPPRASSRWQRPAWRRWGSAGRPRRRPGPAGRPGRGAGGGAWLGCGWAVGCVAACKVSRARRAGLKACFGKWEQSQSKQCGGTSEQRKGSGRLGGSRRQQRRCTHSVHTATVLPTLCSPLLFTSAPTSNLLQQRGGAGEKLVSGGREGERRLPPQGGGGRCKEAHARSRCCSNIARSTRETMRASEQASERASATTYTQPAHLLVCPVNNCMLACSTRF